MPEELKPSLNYLSHPRIMSQLISTPWLIQEDYLAKMIEIVKGFGDLEAVRTKLSRPLEETREAFVRDGVAHIPIMGPIFPRANILTMVSGGVSIDILARDFQVALDNDDVESIILDIDSPGGAVTGINEMANIIRAASDEKDVTAYVSGTGASAAYWLASAAKEVVLDAMARVGSIGVVIACPSKSEDDPVEFWNTASPNKRVDISTDGGKKVIVGELDALAEVFISSVAEYRGTTADDVVTNFGKGGVLVGQNAVDAGMADKLGSFEGLMAEKSNLNTDGGFVMANEKIEITVDSLKASDPDVYEAIKDLGKKEGADSMQKIVASKDSEISELKDRISSQEDRLKALEKTELLRAEREMKVVAKDIISVALVASTVPVRLHDKIRATLDFGKFVVDGKLNHTDFSAHVATEIKGWEVELTDDSVQGFGSTDLDILGNPQAPGDVDSIVNRLAASAGQTIQ